MTQRAMENQITLYYYIENKIYIRIYNMKGFHIKLLFIHYQWKCQLNKCHKLEKDTCPCYVSYGGPSPTFGLYHKNIKQAVLRPPSKLCGRIGTAHIGLHLQAFLIR